MTPPSLHDWSRAGRHETVLGHPLFVRDEGADEGSVVVVLHGFPSASWDFWRVLPRWARRRRVITHDHLGLGLSAKPAIRTTIADQTDRALALWQRLGVSSAHLLAHDYGCSIATELMARWNQGERPLALRSVTLVNSGLYYHMAGLRPIQHLLRMPLTRPLASRAANRWLFERNMRALWGDPSPAAAPDLTAELSILWELASRDGGKVALGRLSDYLEERRLGSRQRWSDAIAGFDRPTHLLWGDRDPVGLPAIAERLANELRDPTLTWLCGVGHYPMLEAADRFAAAAEQFWDARDAAQGTMS